MIILDPTTLAEYIAKVTAATRAQAVLDALTPPVYVNIYDGSGVLRAAGTMLVPWAVRTDGVLTVGDSQAMYVISGGAPDANWYLRFENGSRYVQGRFGLDAPGNDFHWSLPSFATGTIGNIGTVILTAAISNLPPIIGTLPTLTGPAGTQFNLAPYYYDPNGDALIASLSAQTGGHSITAAGVLTLGSASGSITLRVTDTAGTYAQATKTVTVTSSSNADFNVSVSGLTVSVRDAVSNALLFSGTSSNNSKVVIDAQTIGAGPGDIVEFAGGTYPPTVLRDFDGGSEAGRIIWRNKSGQIAIVRRQNAASGNWVFEIDNCFYCDMDGSNGMGNWDPHNPQSDANGASTQHGFRVTFASGATAQNPDSPSQWLKCTPERPSDHITIKRVEMMGDATYAGGQGRSFGGGGYGPNDNVSFSTGNGRYRDGIVMTECWGHRGLFNLIYCGSNYTSDNLPYKNVEISYNRSEDTEEDGLTCKDWWSGTNRVHHNVVARTGHGNTVDTNQRCGMSFIGCTADIYANWIEDAGSGVASVSGFGGTPPSGIVVNIQDGPPRTTAPATGYGVIPTLQVKVYNNIVDGCVENGISLRCLPGLTLINAKAYNNTVVRNGTTGINSGADVTGLIRNNISLQNGTGGNQNVSFAAGMQGPAAANLTGSTLSTYLNANLTLKSAQLVYAGSAIGTDVASTDFDGDPRLIATADKGALEL